MKWYNKYLSAYNTPFSNKSNDIINEVRRKLKNLQSKSPLVTVCIIAYNEEKHLLASLWSLSEMECKYPIEIIGVNNDSHDKTEEIFQAVELPYYNEFQHSCGYARKCGLEHAKGKYHINIDADTLYPPKYVETMVDTLMKPGVVAASSLWSYIPDKDHSWIGLTLYEFTRDCYLFLQSFKRPELSIRGLVFAYHTKYAKEVGIRVDIKRGEDGSLALGLKNYGKISFVRKCAARAVTGYGTVGIDGTLYNSFKVRAIKYIKNISTLFSRQETYKDDNSNLIE